MAEEHTLNERLEKFLDERDKFEFPPGEVARVKLLAKELAKGYDLGLWQYIGKWAGAGSPHPFNVCIRRYFLQRRQVWEFHDSVTRLKRHGYTAQDEIYEALTQSAFDLLNESDPYNVFVSYRRSESSALALLVVCRLKAHELFAFCDMALKAGGNWHANLKQKIEENDYFIVLLGKDTLSSEMTVREILWAVDSKRTIIPIWHNSFGLAEKFDLKAEMESFAAEWKDEKIRNRKDDMTNVINRTNAIRVLDESASGYNTAIVELLNRFGC